MLAVVKLIMLLSYASHENTSKTSSCYSRTYYRTTTFAVSHQVHKLCMLCVFCVLTVCVIVHYKLSTEQSSSLSSYTLLPHVQAFQTQQTSRRYRLLLRGVRTPASVILNLTILRYYVPRLTKTYLPKFSTVQIACSRSTIWEIDHTTDNSQNVHLI